MKPDAPVTRMRSPGLLIGIVVSCDGVEGAVRSFEPVVVEGLIKWRMYRGYQRSPGVRRPAHCRLILAASFFNVFLSDLAHTGVPLQIRNAICYRLHLEKSPSSYQKSSSTLLPFLPPAVTCR